MRIFQDLPPDEQEWVLADAQQTTEAAQAANAKGRASAEVLKRMQPKYEAGQAEGL